MNNGVPLIVLAVLAARAFAFDVGPQVAGYRRDGTGIYPDCTPPTNSLKVEWSIELPSWGLSSPIVIGERVYLTVEPLEGSRDFPALLCVDGKTGAILWDRPLDHLSAVPEADRGAAQTAWHEIMQEYALRQELARAQKRGDTNAVAAAGKVFDKRWDKVVDADEKALKAKLKVAAKGGFTLETWRHDCSGGSCNCVGAAHATPVSDGTHIWTATAWGGFFCHDLDGNQVWVAFAPGQPGEYCRNGRSPILWKNLLISDITALARAFDAATGRLLWSHPVDANTVVSPMVLAVGGADILWAAGCKAFRLPDGAPLPVDGWKEYGMQTLVKYDERDVIFFCGSGEHCGWTDKGGAKAESTPPAAVRFALDGDPLSTSAVLRATVLWHGGSFEQVGRQGEETKGGNKPWMLYYNDGFYHINGAILDPSTGSVKKGRIARRHNNERAVPETSHLLLVANDHVYGLTYQGDLSVYTATGRRTAGMKIPVPAATHNYGWREGRFIDADGPPFTLGRDRIYARSNVHLHCIGP